MRMLIRMMIFTGLCVGSLSAMQDDVSKVTRITVVYRSSLKRHTVAEVLLTIDRETTIEDVVEDFKGNYSAV